MKLRRIRRAAATLAIAALRAIPGTLRDLTGLAGAGAITFGAWQIYPPAGSIVGGGLALFAAIKLAAATMRQPPPEPE